MRTKPKCLKTIEKNLEKNDNNSNTSSFMVTDMLSGSFCSINTDNLSMNDRHLNIKNLDQELKFMLIYLESIYLIMIIPLI